MGKMAVVTKGVHTVMEQEQTGERIVTVVKCVWPGVKLMFAADVKNFPKKCMHTDNVKRLRKMGFTLKAISTILGISPSYVCKMLHS